MKDGSKVATIIQARMGSTRLPGKVMMDIEGKPVLWHVVQRVKAARKSGKVIIATTVEPDDRAIADFASAEGIPFYRGSRDDVLDRYYQAARIYRADPIVRITADCPLLDPDVIDRVVNLYLEGNYNYASNIHPPTFPDGLDTEVFSFAALEKTWHEARLRSEREHVTAYIHKHPDLFIIGNLTCKENLSAQRWTVDEDRDLKFVREVYKRLFVRGRIFYMEDILKLLREHSELSGINKGIERNEGYSKSLREDRYRIVKLD